MSIIQLPNASGGNFSAGVSTLGNTLGSTGLVSQQLVFVAGNNLTLSQSSNGGSATVTFIGAAGGGNFSAGASTGGNTSGTTGVVGSQIVFFGGNNVTLSQSVNGQSASLSIIGPTTAPSLSVGVSTGGNTSNTTGLVAGQLVFAGGNNITLSESLNGVSATITISGGFQYSAGMSTQGNTAGTVGLASNSLLIVGGSNITLSQSLNGGAATLTIIGASGGAGAAYSAGMSTGGNTSGTAGLASNQLVFVGGTNITLSQATNGGSNTITIIGASAPSGFQSAGISTGGNTSGLTGMVSQQLVFVGGNNVTLSGSTNGGAGTITISTPTEQFNLGITNSGNTSGTIGQFSRNYLLVGSNNITLSQGTNTGGSATLTILGPTLFSGGMSTGGNTAGTVGMFASQLVFVGGNNITLSQATNGQSGTITIVGATAAAGFLSAGMSTGGNTSGTAGLASQQLVFVGGTNITLSQATNGGSNTITIIGASGGGGGSFSAGVSTGGNTSGLTGTVSNQIIFAGGGNVTLSQSTGAGGATVTISSPVEQFSVGITGAGNTAGTVGFFSRQYQLVGSNNITLSQSTNTGGSATLTILGPTLLSVGMSTGGNTSGTVGMFASQVVFQGGSNVTLSQITNGQSATIIISANVTNSVSNFSAGVSTGGNSSGLTGTVSNQLIFAGGGNVTLSQSTGAGGATITISSPVEQFSIGITGAGNTAGTVGFFSRQYQLVGSNNITLSQSTNTGGSATLTILGPTLFSGGMSTGGNTAGTVGMFASQLVFVGGTNITLSQATNGQSGTITIVGASAAAGFLSAGMSTGGNTSGTAGLASQQLVLIGGSNITLSQATNGGSNSITILGNAAFSAGVSTGGNSSGLTGTVSNQVVFAGAGNVTLSQSTGAGGATISISSPVEQFSIGITGAGNTLGTVGFFSRQYQLVGSNNITLSQSTNTGGSATLTILGPTLMSAGVSTGGNTQGQTGLVSNQIVFVGSNVTLSQATNGGSATISIIGPSTAGFGFSAGMSTGGNTAGTAAMASNQLVLVGGANVSLSQGTNGGSNTITINAGPPAMSRWVNMIDNIIINSGANFSGTAEQTLAFFPLAANDPFFPANMSVSSVVFNVSASASDTAAFSNSFYFGIYGPHSTATASWVLLNSASTVIGSAAATNKTAGINGMRYITFDATQFSNNSLSLSEGGQYIGATMMKGSLVTPVIQFAGRCIQQNYPVRSGIMGVTVTSGNNSNAYPGAWNAIYNTSTGALPAAVNITSDLNFADTGEWGNFVPQIQFENVRSRF